MFEGCFLKEASPVCKRGFMIIYCESTDERLFRFVYRTILHE